MVFGVGLGHLFDREPPRIAVTRKGERLNCGPAKAKGVAMNPRWIEVNDRMQQGYRYVLTVPAGRDFDPEFRPDLTPAEMLALGVFGGKYMTDCRDEFRKAGSQKLASRRSAARRRVRSGPIVLG